MDYGSNNNKDGDNRTKDGNNEKSGIISAPSVSLPKGGGAIRGIGEKFAANPVTGTGSMTVPIATSPGRSGFGPQLSLSYDSGAGNGPFGFGWNLSLPAITRKTDKGLPRYQDADDSDVFVLSGAEDLVPVLVDKEVPPRIVDGKNYRIQRYRPRIEGLFARIERWANQDDPTDTFWRSLSKDNITTWYGRFAESRIADPANPSRIFSWLICESYDDKGNVIVYGYKGENSDNVDLAQAHERNRTDLTRSANRYLKRVRYGNHAPYLPTLSDTTPWPIPPGATTPDGSQDWFFELVFDYGEHDENAPVPQDTSTLWDCRKDPFSSYRATFEVRTYRLCQRVLMFHHFPEEEGVGRNCLVRSTDFTYSFEETPTDPRNPIYSFLLAITQTGYKRHDGSYLAKSLPPLEFEYTQPTIDETVREVDAKSLENLPYGLDGSHYQWVDLDGEGLSGILTEQAGTWFYKRNLSPYKDPNEGSTETPPARFGPIELVARRPSLAALGAGRQQLLDLAGDGNLDLVEFETPAPGFFERTIDKDWEPFAPFRSLPDLDWDDPNLKFVDLTGDGHADILISHDDTFCWHESLAEAGFGPEARVLQAFDEEKGPKLLFADATQSTFLADLSGDGLTDLVRIRNGEVCYWPNLGYGRFGAKVAMDNSPRFESQDLFDGRRLRLADIDGTGTTDIIYFASAGVQLYFNQSGNGWGEKRALRGFPAVESQSLASALDLLGNGTACLVWSSPLPGNASRPMRYIDLMGGQKPHLLVKVTNNLGAETHVQYAPSTQFYVADKLAGRPWITRLPFPVHAVERVETIDRVSRNRFVTRYAYHHGFYDGFEREFRGFGMVEQFDTEEGAVSYDFATIDVPVPNATSTLTSTFWWGINDAGLQVGSLRDSDGIFQGVSDISDSSNTIDPSGFKESQASGINDLGVIVGAAKKDISTPFQAYISTQEGFEFYTHPDAGPNGTYFNGINNKGLHVGSYFDDGGVPHAIIRIGTSTTRLEDILRVPANTGTFIFDVNNLGQMVGGYFDAANGVQHGFFTDGKTFVTIDFPGSSVTWLNGINDLGQMVGGYFDDIAQVWNGFVTDGKSFSVLDYPAVPGQHPGSFLTGINNAGRIVGYYGDDLNNLNKAGIHGLLAAPVPFSPPVCTKTWFHTGAYLGKERISKHFEKEYYHEGDASDDFTGLLDKQLEAMLLDDTVLTQELTDDEAREAARALKGSILRQEIYALDGTDAADRPYSASERNYTIELLQPKGSNRHAVFFAHARETIDFHYERKLYKVKDGNIVSPDTPNAKAAADPRVTHAMTLAVDSFGNVLQSVAIGYGRRYNDPTLIQADRDKQSATLVTYTENGYTNAILEDDAYRVPLPCETRTYELINVKPDPLTAQPDVTNLFRFGELVDQVQSADKHDIPYEDVDTTGVPSGQPSRRIIEHVRTLYRGNDMKSLLPLVPLGQLKPLESLALPGETYKLAFTPGLLSQVYQRGQESLLPVPEAVLGGQAGSRGGYLQSQALKEDGRFPATDADDHWWIPSGRIFYHPDANATPQQELDKARQHFFLPRRFEDPFGKSSTVDYDEPFDLLVVRTTDAVENTVTARIDYRVLQPTLVVDPNDNRAAVSFDVLGLVAGTAVMGKTTENLGDSLEDFEPDLTADQINKCFDADDPHAEAGSLLGIATTRIIYDVDRFRNTGEPVFAAILARETHSKDPVPAGGLKIQISFSYSDGFGREIQKKIQAEPGPVVDGGPVVNPRWVGSGWTIFNNKGKPVRQYEPFFSQLPTKGHRFEFGVKVGVSPILCYDPLQRVVATIHPNHTYEKVVFDPWRQETWDVNDTVTSDPKADSDVGSFFKLLPDDDYLPTWYTQRVDGALGPEEKDAAGKAAAHANTPTVAHFNTLGRTFLTIAKNRFQRQGTTVEESYPTRVALDIEGNQREVRDAIVQAGDPLGRIVMKYDYDLLGNRIHQASMEAGERWMLNDVTSKPIRAWDSRGHAFRTEYDALRRPVKALVQGADPQNQNLEILFEQTVYGDRVGPSDDKALNLRTRVFRHFDNAGIVTNFGRNPITNKDEAYDFKGNLLRSSRELAQQYKGLIDWNAVQPPGEVFSTSTTYDALNRPTAVISPDKSVYRPTYNEANLLDKVDVNLRGATIATSFVTNIDYNAKGQRMRIDYSIRDGKSVSTFYDYDPQTFRLTRLKTTRPVGLNGLASQLFKTDTTIQDLRYTYDPAGNITRITDDALSVIVFANQQVDPACDYAYDAIYRLIQAKGREHIGQTAFQPPLDCNFRDYPFAGLNANPNDIRALRNYTEQYEYDAVGNFEKLIHQFADGSWIRRYAYNEDSLLERTTKKSNRLSSTTVGQTTEAYRYQDAQGLDVQGCMTAINAMRMDWDFKDQLQRVELGGGCTAYYVYDASGQRTRKVVEKNNGNLIEEHIYLGGFEMFRQRNGNGIKMERETLHVMDDKQRIALVETRTQGDDGSPAQLIRYQLGNHLGSASLELDDQGQVITYEEYHPYGTSSYQAVNKAIKAAAKRYRYTGKERDEESGFAYHGGRYYAPWLGRWNSCDPKGMMDGENLYIYTGNRPVTHTDDTGMQGNETHKPSLFERFKRGVGEGAKQALESLKNFPGTPLAIVGQVKTGVEIVEAFQREKSVGAGLAMAANVLNPAYHAAVAAHESQEAASEGKYGEATVQGVAAAVGVVQTVGLALGAAGAARGAFKPSTTVGKGVSAGDSSFGSTANFETPIPETTTQLPPEPNLKVPQKVVLSEPEVLETQNPFDFMQDLEAMGTRLQSQVNEASIAVKPFQGFPVSQGGVPYQLQVGGATTTIEGVQVTTITFSHRNAHALFESGLLPLPEGTILGPAPPAGKLPINLHVERTAITPLEARGAKGGLTTSSGLSCEKCAEAWQQGQFPTWLHMHFADYGF